MAQDEHLTQMGDDPNPAEIAGQEPLSMVRMTRKPDAVLAEAKEAATALIKVVDDKKWSLQIGASTHLMVEAWQTCAQFFGITARVTECLPVTLGDARGFKAKAVAIHASTGRVLSAGEMYCMNDEENWSTRPKYEWRDKKSGGGREKVKVGDVPVPMYQLASMAQTRAVSKALRNVLSWVVVLAGYNATPAEEADGSSSFGGGEPTAEQPARASESSGGNGKTLILNLDNLGLAMTGTATFDLKEEIKRSGGKPGKTSDQKAFAWRFPSDALVTLRDLARIAGVALEESDAVKGLDQPADDVPF